MKNKTLVYEFVQKEMMDQQVDGQTVPGVQTQKVAEHLGMKRSNASALLNQLVKEGQLSKTKTRPVHYFLPQDTTRDVFDRLVGANGSLKKAIKLAKAAILYPSGCLRIGIKAASGSGTSELIKRLIAFAQQEKIISAQSPHIEINCRTYAGDQAYLEKALFGDDQQEDVLNRAQSGVLLIDHYDYLDRSLLAKLNGLLGHSDYTPHLLVILTCTPNAAQSIDVPIEIQLPDFASRPYGEKLGIIESEFNKEAKSAKRDIVVPIDLIKALILTSYPHNLKDIKKLIVMASANAYIRAVNRTDQRIYLTLSDIPSQVSLNLIKARSSNAELQAVIGNREKFIFSPEEERLQTQAQAKNIYRNITQEYHQLAQEGITREAIQKAINLRIQDLFDEFSYFNTQDQTRNKAELSKIVPLPIITMVEDWLKTCEQKLNRHFDANIFYGLCLHLNSLITLKVTNRHLPFERTKLMFARYQTEYQATQTLAEQIKDHYGLILDDSELAILMMFLVEPEQKAVARPVLLYAMHGNGVAKYLSEVTNTLNHAANTYAYDMNLDKDSKTVYHELENLLYRIDQGKGVIVIYDMGSFKTMLTSLAQKTKIPLRLLPIPITMVGLEISRKSLTEDDLDDIYHNVKANLKRLTGDDSRTKPNLVITLCHTGEGGAVQLKDYIEQYSHLDWQVKAMSISERELLVQKVERLRQVYHLKAFVGTYDPHLFGVPFIPIKEVFETPKDELDKVLTFMPVNHNHYLWKQIYDRLGDELTFAPLAKIKEVLPKILSQLIEQYDLDENQQVGVFTHLATLIDAILAGRPRPKSPLNSEQRQAVKSDFRYLGKLLRPVEKAFNLVFSDEDLYYLIAIVKKILV